MKADEKPTFSLFLFTLLAIIPEMWVTAWVFTCLWRWFATPTFHLASPSAATMAGLFCMRTMVRGIREQKKPIVDLLVEKAVTLALILGAGYVFHRMT